jgi:hypothetical protein
MAANPVSDEIAAALGAFCRGGSGPTHTALSRVFQRCGYASAAPYAANDPFNQPNKEVRVTETVAAAAPRAYFSSTLVKCGGTTFQNSCVIRGVGSDLVVEGGTSDPCSIKY